MILKILRKGLGRIIIFIDYILAPKKIIRTAEEQQKVNDAVKNLSLYQFYACPFCIKVRRTMRRLNLEIKTIDAQDKINKLKLIEKGGKFMVPCLKIKENKNTVWLYESDAIIDYLDKRFGV